MKYSLRAKWNRFEDDVRCAIGCFLIKLGSYIAVNMTDYSFWKGADEVDWKRRPRKRVELVNRDDT